MTSLEINGSRFPHRIQNILIREYCNRLEHSHLFSLTEVSVPGAHFVLKDLLSLKESYGGLVFFSLYMLPKNPALRHEVYKLVEEGKEIHFCFEQRIIKDPADISFVEDILSVRRALESVPFGGRYRVGHSAQDEVATFLGVPTNSF